jgi:hypothetical protein
MFYTARLDNWFPEDYVAPNARYVVNTIEDKCGAVILRPDGSTYIIELDDE